MRLRFPEKIVERLLAVQWWNYSIYDLFEAPMDSIEAALDVIEELVAAGKVAPYSGPIVTPEDLLDPMALVARLAAPAMDKAG